MNIDIGFHLLYTKFNFIQEISKFLVEFPFESVMTFINMKF